MSFEEVELTTERLILHRADANIHASEINAGVCESIDSLKEFLPWAKETPTVEETKTGLQRVAGNPKHYAFRLYLHNTSKLIGMCGIVWKSPDEHDGLITYEVGYWINKEHTRKGLITEALQRIMKFAVDVKKAQKFTLDCDEKNIASKKIAQKFGFNLCSQKVTTQHSRPDWGEFVLNCYEKMA